MKSATGSWPTCAAGREGGVGLIVTEVCAVHPLGKGFPTELCALRRLVPARPGEAGADRQARRGGGGAPAPSRRAPDLSTGDRGGAGGPFRHTRPGHRRDPARAEQAGDRGADRLLRQRRRAGPRRGFRRGGDTRRPRLPGQPVPLALFSNKRKDEYGLPPTGAAPLRQGDRRGRSSGRPGRISRCSSASHRPSWCEGGYELDYILPFLLHPGERRSGRLPRLLRRLRFSGQPHLSRAGTTRRASTWRGRRESSRRWGCRSSWPASCTTHAWRRKPSRRAGRTWWPSAGSTWPTRSSSTRRRRDARKKYAPASPATRVASSA